MTDSLREIQLASGGIMEGDRAPCHYGDPEREYASATTAAALFDLTDRAHVEITGNDRHAFLHNFCTNDIKKLEPGQGCEAFVTNIKGRVLGHVFVFATETALWLETVGGAEAKLIAHLDRYIIAEDVELFDRTPEFGELLVSGPAANERLRSLGVATADGPLAHVASEWNGIPLDARNVDWLGNPAVLLLASRDQIPRLWQSLTEGEIPPAGGDCFHALRIESLFPLYGVDITDEQIAQEVGRTSQAISFVKGCYLGQEPIARLDAMGHVNRALRGLRLESGPAPAAGSAVIDDAGNNIGSITSTAISPGSGQPVALAYLRRGSLEPETTVVLQEGNIPAIVFATDDE